MIFTKPKQQYLCLYCGPATKGALEAVFVSRGSLVLPGRGPLLP